MKTLVNSEQWLSAAEDARDCIRQGLSAIGVIDMDHPIVPDPHAPAFDLVDGISLQWNPITNVERIASDAVAGIGFAWCCSAVLSQKGLVACFAAVEGARQNRQSNLASASIEAAPST